MSLKYYHLILVTHRALPRLSAKAVDTSLAFTKVQTISSPQRGAHHWIHQTLVYRLVVERSPIRSFAADCPINTIFKPSHLAMFHAYVVVSIALRGFQQFNGLFFIRITA